LATDNIVTGRHTIQSDARSIKVFENGILKNQIDRASVPPKNNSFVFSPSGEYFVSYEEAENETREMFFYRSDGTLLNKQIINIHPNVKFSGTGEYVEVFNNSGREIFLFYKTGQLLFKADYMELIHDNSKALNNIRFSETGSEFIINAGDDVYLIDIRTKQPKFKTKVGKVLDGNFYSSKDKIILKTLDRNSRLDMQVLSKSNGNVSDVIQQVSDVFFLPAGPIVSRQAKFLEYVIK
jgi:hypothetical protein